MVQDAHTRMEEYHTWEKAQRHPIKSRKGRTPCRKTSIQTEDEASETDIATGHNLATHHKSLLITCNRQHQKKE